MHSWWVSLSKLGIHCSCIEAWTPQSVPMDVNPLKPKPKFHWIRTMPRVVHCLQHFAQACSAWMFSLHLHSVKDFKRLRKNGNPWRWRYHVLVVSQIPHDWCQISIFPCREWKVIEDFLRGPGLCRNIRLPPSTTSQARKEILDLLSKALWIAPGQRSWMKGSLGPGVLGTSGHCIVDLILKNP